MVLRHYESFQQEATWDHATLGAPEVMEAEMLQRLLDAHSRRQPEVRPVRIVWWKRAAVAAAVLLIAGTAWLQRDALQQWLNPVKQIAVAAAGEERKSFQLSDGSRIWLSPSSVIRFPEHFPGRSREVELEGEAFFEVAADEEKPFIIRSGGLVTRILGTSFNVQSYASQEQIAVTVVTGKVAVSMGEQAKPVEVMPDERAVFHKQSQQLSKEAFPGAAKLLNRRDGLLAYDGTPVAEVLNDLRLYYGLQITIKGDINSCTYYGTLKQGDNAAVFLKKLCFLIHADLQQTDSGYTIQSDGCR